MVFIFAAELFFQFFDQTPLIFRVITFYQKPQKDQSLRSRRTFYDQDQDPFLNQEKIKNSPYTPTPTYTHTQTHSLLNSLTRV